MSVDEFRKSTAGAAPPGLSGPLLALWHDARGDWDAAHKASQQEDGADGAWVHAYLHRKEGDLSNAAYWYRRAGHPIATSDLPAEWSEIARILLSSR